MTAAPYLWRPPSRVRTRIWPIRAVRDARQPPARSEDEVFQLVNCYARDTEIGPLLVGRPGFSQMGVQLGTGANRTTQLVYQFTKRAGTEHSIAIVGGQFYTFNWATDTWTEVLDAADFSGASITLSATAMCSAVTLADNVVISDGVNTPWMWDGTAGAGLTSLTNAPVFFGPMVIRAGKLFGIKNAARQTFVWSEEGDPTTGYEAGGFNNAWDFIQTATEGLVALASTDDALYVYRTNSTSAVFGEVSTDFATTSTKEAVSSALGTRSPWGTIVVNNEVWFLDQYGQFQVASPRNARQIASGSRVTLRSLNFSALDTVQVVDDPETGHVKFYLPGSGQTAPNFGVWIGRDTGRFAATETGYKGTRWALLKHANGFPTIVHGGGTDPLTSASGYLYDHGHESGQIGGNLVWDDELASGDQSIAHIVETPPVGHDTAVDKVFLRGDLSLLSATQMTGMSLVFVTPYGTSSPLALATVDSGALFYDTGLQYDAGHEYGDDVGDELKQTWHMRERGRSLRVQLAHNQPGEEFGLSELSVEHVPVTRRGEVP